MLFGTAPLEFPLGDRVRVTRHLQALEHGRRVTTDEVFRRVLEARASFFVVGARGMGKTSLLNELAWRGNQGATDLLVFGPISFAALDLDSPQSFSHTFFGQLGRFLSDLPLTDRIPTASDLLDQIPIYLQALSGARGCLVRTLFLLDDLDAAPNVARIQILSIFKRLYEQFPTRVQLGYAGNFVEDEIASAASVIGDFARVYALGAFDAEEWDQILAAAVRALRVQVPLEAVAELRNWTQGNPYFAQMAMLGITARARDSRVMSVNVVQEICESAQAEAYTGEYTRLLGETPDDIRGDTQELLNALIQTGSVPVDWQLPAVRHLWRLGLIQRDADGRARWSNPLLARWFKHSGAIIAQMPWSVASAPANSGLARMRRGAAAPAEEPSYEAEATEPARYREYPAEDKELMEEVAPPPEAEMELNESRPTRGPTRGPTREETEEARPSVIYTPERREPSQPQAMERYVNLWFTRDRADETCIEKHLALTKGQPIYLRVQIAPYDRLERTILIDATPFTSQEEIERAHPEVAGKPIPLEVTLFSSDFDIPEKERTQGLTLVRGKPTETRYFQVTPLRLGVAHLRVCVFYQNHLLQALGVSASVAEREEQARESQAARVEMTFSADFARVDQFQPRGLWLGINETPEGSHALNVKGDEVALTRRLAEKLPKALEIARQALREVSFDLEKDEEGNPVIDLETGKERKIYRFDKDNFPRKGDEAGRIKRFKEDLTKLARAGGDLYDAVFGTGQVPTAEERDRVEPLVKQMKKALREEQVIQIARLKNLADIWPWALMYDLVIDADNVKEVCLSFRSDDGRFLPYAEGIKRCRHFDPVTGLEDETVVCPYGFWGFKHIIEQPMEPGGKKAFEDLPLEVKMGAQPVLEMPLATGLVQVEPEHVRRMESLNFQPLNSANEVIAALAPNLNPPEPHVMYFFCHGKRDSNNKPYLQVGQKDALLPSKLDKLDFRWNRSHGLVFINGCHTVDLEPDDLSVIMAPFVEARASGVIGTEVTVHTFLAREFAQKFFERLLPNGQDKQPVGQIIKDLRRELLLKYNPLGLVYTPYCSADLRLTR